MVNMFIVKYKAKKSTNVVVELFFILLQEINVIPNNEEDIS